MGVTVATGRCLEFICDLQFDEVRRRNAILNAIGDEWDPIQTLADEDQAYSMLYSDLDDDQQRAYDELVAAGVLPRSQDWTNE